ncbi:Hypothetical predicted protein [Xyrichtys novacula]|uniref:Uncharacterized protein n=1 Tax=Xyrichtys novacula TaxID=13765 RepID=A0AAV1GEQ0_XYRNO|nr:Hypothetical predicted protein [Xyrichtys novacula]
MGGATQGRRAQGDKPTLKPPGSGIKTVKTRRPAFTHRCLDLTTSSKREDRPG